MNSKIVFDFDGVLTDYNQFIQKNAIGYFQKKYQMNIIIADALEIEEIFDIQNVLKNLGYSEQEAIHIQEKMLNHFWISHRFVKYILLNRFRSGVSKYINYLRKQGFTSYIVMDENIWYKPQSGCEFWKSISNKRYKHRCFMEIQKKGLEENLRI